MRPIHVLPLLLLPLCACGQGGTSTAEVRSAAIDRAREELRIGGDIPLEATVWVGQPHEGEVTVCGTVSSTGAARVRPQRFAATTSPIRWLIFEDAHASTVPSQPDKFPEWSRICGRAANV